MEVEKMRRWFHSDSVSATEKLSTTSPVSIRPLICAASLRSILDFSPRTDLCLPNRSDQPVAKSPGSSSGGSLQVIGAWRFSCTVPQGKVILLPLVWPLTQRWRRVS